MFISDIQLIGNEITGKVEITFADEEDCQDIMTMKLNVSDIWTISRFCSNHLSYGAQSKKSESSK